MYVQIVHIQEYLKNEGYRKLFFHHSHISVFIVFVFNPVIVKATNGPRYVVGCRRQVGSEQMLMG